MAGVARTKGMRRTVVRDEVREFPVVSSGHIGPFGPLQTLAATLGEMESHQKVFSRSVTYLLKRSLQLLLS